MKVAYILISSRGEGGATKSFLSMMRGLRQKGVTPLVILPDDGGVCKLLREEGIETFCVPYRFAAYPHIFESWRDYILFVPRTVGRIVMNYMAAKSITKKLRDWRPDLIHSNNSVIDVGFVASRSLSVPHVCHIREYGDKDFSIHYYPTKRRFLRFLSHDQSYNICITKDIQQHHCLSNSRRSVIIYNGIHPAADTLPEQIERNYLLYAGRIEPTKGIDQMMEAYNEYVRKSKCPMKLYVAGRIIGHEYAEGIKAYLKDNKLDSMVSMLGIRTDMNNLYVGAKATIVPSKFEGFGRVMPEAMFQGSLVVARNTGGSKEQLDNGIDMTGKPIAYAFDTTAELTDILLNLDTISQKEIMEMRQRAFGVVNKLYTTEANVDGVWSLYKQILKNK